MMKRSEMIAYLLLNTFNLRQARAQMYVDENPYQEVPALYFHLKTDNTTESDYQLIKEAVETFKGNLKWRFGKGFTSKINYEIVPQIVRDKKVKNPEKIFKDSLPEWQYERTCELAIADIPYLYEHMKEYFEKNKPSDND